MHVTLHEDAKYTDGNVAEPIAETPFHEEATPEVLTLRRTGLRPLSFRGNDIAHGMSFRVGPPLWYEINVFKVATGGYVADVRMFTKADGESDKFTVVACETLEQVAEFLEGYEPALDVDVAMDVDNQAAPLTDVAFQALAVRLRVESAKTQYASLVSEIFAQLQDAESAAQ